MNRAQKINLLTRVLQGERTDGARRQLLSLVDSSPRALIVITEPDQAEHCYSGNSPVHFNDQGQTHHMTWPEMEVYTRRHRVTALVAIPDNHRD